MWAFSDNSWWSRSSVSIRGIFEPCIAVDFNAGFRWSLIKWNLRSVVCSTPWFLVFCSICHVIDFHEHSTWWLGFEYDSFKATFPQRLPEFCQSPMALLTYSDDPWLPGWTRLLGQALPSPPNPAWVCLFCQWPPPRIVCLRGLGRVIITLWSAPSPLVRISCPLFK